MLIEYKIKFENSGVTITQRVEPGSSSAVIPPPSVAGTSTQATNLQLGDHYVAPQTASSPKHAAGGGNAVPPGTGEGNTLGTSFGSGLTILFGPIVIGPAAANDGGGGNAVPPTNE